MSAATVAIAPFDNLSGDPAQDYFARGIRRGRGDRALQVRHAGSPASARSRRRCSGTRRRSRPPGFRPTTSSTAASATPATPSGSTCNSSKRPTAGNSGPIGTTPLPPTCTRCRTPSPRASRERWPSQIDEARLGLARRAPLASLEVYDCWLRGLECLRKGRSRRMPKRAASSSGRWRSIRRTRGRTQACRCRTSTNGVARPGQMGREGTTRPRIRAARAVARRDRCDGAGRARAGSSSIGDVRRSGSPLERALLLNPNDTDVLVHAGLCQAYLGDPEAALATATKAMRLNPAFPPWYAAPAGLSLFLLGRDRECLELCAARRPRMFVDVAAFAAASCALTGDMEPARSVTFSSFWTTSRNASVSDAQPSPASRCAGCCTSTRSSVPRTANAWRVACALAGLDADPDEGRPEAVARPVAPDASPATFRRDGPLWTMAFGGVSVRLTHQKGFLDLAQLLARPGTEMHCLELADRPGGDRRRRAGARRSRAPRAQGACARSPAGDRRSRRRARPGPGRSAPGRSSIRIVEHLSERSGSAAAQGSWAARPSARGRP